MISKLKRLLRGEVTFREVVSYLQGELRYKLYFSHTFSFLIRPHIKDQIAYRIRVMNPECWSRGSCIKCGCEVPALQMASKSCDGCCYPPFIPEAEWKEKEIIREKGERRWIYNAHERKYNLFIETKTSYVRVNQCEAGYG